MTSPEMERLAREQARINEARLDEVTRDSNRAGAASSSGGFDVERVGTPSGVAVTRTFGGTLKRGAKVFAGILGTLGVVTLINSLTGGALNQMFGLLPRTASGAWGILLHPFLHANASHLAMNSVGIVLMGGTVFLRSERDFWRVTTLGVVLAGSATWLVGRPSIHVGASGVVFAYLGYLLTTGWFDRKITSVALSIGAAFLWGSALLGLSPLQQGISWELHSFGLIAGAVAAWWRKKTSTP